MPKYSSPNWDESVGVCIKHGIPMLPCPSCLFGSDIDLEVKLTPAERDVLDYRSLFPAGEIGDKLFRKI